MRPRLGPVLMGGRWTGAPGLAGDGTDKGGFVKAIGGEGDLVINGGKQREGGDDKAKLYLRVDG